MVQKPAFRNCLKPLIRTVCVLGVLLTMLFIFSNSAETGAHSQQQSGKVMQLLGRLMDALGVAPEHRPEEFVIRKLGHFGEFALLGFWLFCALRSFTNRILPNLGWALFTGLGTAVLDEGLQLLIPQRSGEVRDIMIDFSGAAAGMLTASLVILLVLWIYRKYRCRTPQ